MLLDNENVFSDAQAITGDAVSTNVIDMVKAGLAPGNDLNIVLNVEEDFDNLTSLDIEVQSCALEDFSSGVTTHQSINKLLAALTNGTQVDVGPLLNGTLQYVRLNYNVNGTDPTAGKVTAAILPFGQQTLPNQA